MGLMRVQDWADSDLDEMHASLVRWDPVCVAWSAAFELSGMDCARPETGVRLGSRTHTMSANQFEADQVARKMLKGLPAYKAEWISKMGIFIDTGCCEIRVFPVGVVHAYSVM